MITCPECNARNSDENKFCGQCASLLPVQVIEDEPQDPLTEDEPATAEGPAKEEVDEEALIKSAYNYQPLIKLLKAALITFCVTFVLLLTANLVTKYSVNKVSIGIAAGVFPLIILGSWIVKFVLGSMLVVGIWQNAQMLNVIRPTMCKNLKSIFWLRLMTTFAARLSTLSFVDLWVWVAIDVFLLWLRDWTIARKFPSRVTLWQMAIGALVGLMAALGYN